MAGVRGGGFLGGGAGEGLASVWWMRVEVAVQDGCGWVAPTVLWAGFGVWQQGGEVMVLLNQAAVVGEQHFRFHQLYACSLCLFPMRRARP